MRTTSRFEEIGIERQYASQTITEANKHYEKSCYICIMHGIHMECRNCHINGAHDTVVDMLGCISNN